MKILRLRLRHYRGVDEREICFAPSGVTVVEGPNEVGKSSIAEAIDLLFEELDNTTKQRVREVKPVDRDEGSEIEADVESGPYAFTYTKQFHRKPSTRLALQRPRIETLTGREAHDRVREILAETLDIALWRALRLQQGEPLLQPELGEAPSLATALDRAAGAGGGGEREESLFDAAREVYDSHFTATGRPKRDAVAVNQRVDLARAQEERSREILDALEGEVDREAALRVEVADLELEVERATARVRVADDALQQIRGLREAAAQLGTRCDAAQALEREATQASRQRSQLLAAHLAAIAEMEALSEALESEEPAHVAAAAELRHVEERLAEARAAHDAAAERERVARRDCAFRRGERELQALRDRDERARHAMAESLRSREILAGPAIDENHVEAIQAVQLDVDRARARLAADGPTVHVTPQVDLVVVVDGKPMRLRAGAPVSQRVSEAMVLSLPGFAELTVVAGAAVAERRKALEHAETELRTLCAEVGVDAHGEALHALAARRAAEQSLARSERHGAEALGEWTADQLGKRIEALAERCAAYTNERCADIPLPESLEAADAQLEEGEALSSAERERVRQLGDLRDDLARRFQHLDAHQSDTRNRLSLAQEGREGLERRIEAARSEADDDEIESQLEARAAAARELEARHREACERLAAAEPEEAEAEAARRALAGGRRSLRDRREELVAVRAVLESQGSAGAFEQWEQARIELERAERDAAARTRRADAARLLFETLRDERDAARASYAGPLAEQVEALGRPLYGDSFAVELADDLQVERRILDGKGLALTQLSAGAREQLALLTRLAAALVASGEEGVPVVLDDALGHTDPGRLAALGPVLARAGAVCQVIVLTCTPDRFDSVTGADFVALR